MVQTVKNIAFFHNSLNSTDGVSLEVDKWRICLERMGHNVYYCAGNKKGDTFQVPELDFLEEEAYKIIRNATKKLEDYTEAELKDAILRKKEIIKKKILNFIDEKKIDLLIPNNLLSVGINVPGAIALYEIIEETKLPTICHHHDFYFEDNIDVNPTCPFVKEMFELCVPPRFDHVTNVVINKIAQRRLMEERNTDSIVVPNTFDFDLASKEVDDYNRDFRAHFGIGANDILILQATRILNRKCIELAIDFVAELNKHKDKLTNLFDGRTFGPDNEIVLLCAGRKEIFGSSKGYYEKLEKKAKELNINMRFIGDCIKHDRGEADGKKLYSLFDTYNFAGLVTFPSCWEGWGNQLIEAVHAKLPVVIFEYPVFKTDIADSNFDFISLGDQIIKHDSDGLAVIPEENVKQAAERAIQVLTDSDYRQEMVDKNFVIGKENFSLDMLSKLIEQLISRFWFAADREINTATEDLVVEDV